MALRLFERTLASVKPDLRPLYIADAEHGFRLERPDAGMPTGTGPNRVGLNESYAAVGRTRD